MPKPNDEIEHLRNIGPVSAAWLRGAGISTCGELKRVGAVVAYTIVRKRLPQASLNLLWALAAGLTDTDWRELTNEQKQSLRRQLRELTGEDKRAKLS